MRGITFSDNVQNFYSKMIFSPLKKYGFLKCAIVTGESGVEAARDYYDQFLKAMEMKYKKYLPKAQHEIIIDKSKKLVFPGKVHAEDVDLQCDNILLRIRAFLDYHNSRMSSPLEKVVD